MKISENIEVENVNVPDKIAREIHLRSINAMRVNTDHAGKLHEDGREFAMSNHIDVGIQAWLLFQMQNGPLTPREAIEMFMEVLTTIILPRFATLPPIMAMIKKEIDNPPNEREESILAQVNEMLIEAGMNPIICSGTIPEIIAQLQGLHEGKNETKQ